MYALSEKGWRRNGNGVLKDVQNARAVKSVASRIVSRRSRSQEIAKFAVLRSSRAITRGAGRGGRGGGGARRRTKLRRKRAGPSPLSPLPAPGRYREIGRPNPGRRPPSAQTSVNRLKGVAAGGGGEGEREPGSHAAANLYAGFYGCFQISLTRYSALWWRWNQANARGMSHKGE